MRLDLTPRHLIAAYAAGIFPMADDDGTVHWLAPDPRAIIPLDGFKVPRSLRQRVRRGDYVVTINRCFLDVMRACADRREGTWISDPFYRAYGALHEEGFAHSVETWAGEELVGGLYGVALGGAFFGESMFHRQTDASKVALVALVERMRERGFALLDTQFTTPHLEQFGTVEIPRREYQKRLAEAVARRCAFDDPERKTWVDPPGAGSAAWEDEPTQ